MPNWNTLYGKLSKGNKSVVCARVDTVNTTSFLAVHFAKRNVINCDGEKKVSRCCVEVFYFYWTQGELNSCFRNANAVFYQLNYGPLITSKISLKSFLRYLL